MSHFDEFWNRAASAAQTAASATKRADKVVILDKGRVVDVGTHEELSQRPGYYREVFLLQNGMEEEKEVV